LAPGCPDRAAHAPPKPLMDLLALAVIAYALFAVVETLID
jgi:hypothetical protein